MDSATHMLRTGQRGTLFQLQMAGRDLRNSFGRIGLAWSLAWHNQPNPETVEAEG